MPAKRKKEKIVARYFSWLLGIRNGIYFADGRSNHPHQVGRHSLGTEDRQEALEQLKQLDLVKAVEFGRADRDVLKAAPAKTLLLSDGKDLYFSYLKRPPVVRGATKKTVQRYNAVFDKFIPFAQSQGIRDWQDVDQALVLGYGASLDDRDYAARSLYLELTTIKQAMKWLATAKHIPISCLFALALEKPSGTTAYCYTQEQVDAMVEVAFSKKDLIWLGEVIIALATTGLRIGELASLRWEDFDLPMNTIRLTDTRRGAKKSEREKARSTKSHRDRSLPIHGQLRRILENKSRHADGRVFHGPLGGALKPDTVRNVLIREVLKPLAKRFPATSEKKGFRNGRLHSFRHYFCSMSATSGVPEQMLMS